jgi:pyruvate/2-oxoglutarate dehydrogenase complex dihydrolipoamide acyltransferase (E2) component
VDPSYTTSGDVNAASKRASVLTGSFSRCFHEADDRDLANLMVALRDLVNRARARTRRVSEMSDPTITVTSLGPDPACPLDISP